jgi:hypothetical protein
MFDVVVAVTATVFATPLSFGGLLSLKYCPDCKQNVVPSTELRLIKKVVTVSVETVGVVEGMI